MGIPNYYPQVEIVGLQIMPDHLHGIFFVNFRVRHGLVIGCQQFSAIGNLFLLERPICLQVQCSRSLTEEQIVEKVVIVVTTGTKWCSVGVALYL